MSAELQGIGMTSRRTRMRLVQRLREAGIESERVLEVIGQVPRHIFVDEALAHRAYEDTALPIGYGQTLSQPYIVARMTELLLRHEPGRVLELGTGSGYQTAVLAQLVREVYSVERIKPLQDKARERLRQLGLAQRHAQACRRWHGLAGTGAVRRNSGDRGAQRRTRRPAGAAGGQRGVDRAGGRIVPGTGGGGAPWRPVRAPELEPVMFVPLLGGVVR